MDEALVKRRTKVKGMVVDRALTPLDRSAALAASATDWASALLGNVQRV